jgi:cathepsin B
MLRIILIAAAVALAAAYPRTPEMAFDSEFVAHVNSNQSDYVAGLNEKFRGWTLLEASRLMGVKSLVPSGVTPVKTHNIAVEDIPESFDARKQWPSFIHPIRDQQQCGSCWAFSGAEVLGDRFTIATNGKVNVVLSPEDMVSCDTGDMGCSGGMLDTEWQYLVNTGIVSDACFPYAAGGGQAPACQAKCSDSETYTKYQAADSFHLSSVTDIQAEVMKNGPVQAAFLVYKSFLSYKSGIYNKHWWQFWDQELGGHAVKIVGWGTEKGTPYWIVANSWSTTWGEDGYFRIKRGGNVCQFESMVYGGHAKV